MKQSSSVLCLATSARAMIFDMVEGVCVCVCVCEEVGEIAKERAEGSAKLKRGGFFVRISG